MSIKEYLSAEKIKTRVSELSNQINSDYDGKEIVVIGILNGSVIFTTDLIREINCPIYLDFMKVSSYGEGTESSGSVDIKLDTKVDLKDKHVLIVEDIIDTGLTMKVLLAELEKRGPASLKVASLLFKPARNTHKVPIDYLGFEIDDLFVIGYGLDLAGKYRELPYVGLYSED